MEAPPLLAMRGIEKTFPGVKALRGVSLELRAGEVLALVGENGAGKSTLMKVLGGIVHPDAGEVLLDGRPARLPDPAAARALGIRLIHQELMLCPNLDIAGNVFLGEERGAGGGLGLLPRRKLAAEAASWTARVGLDLPPGTPVKELSPGQMQLVEIAKALAGRARVLVMDEPTSSLTLSETERLFAIIGELRAGGMGIIYISHRLEEVFRIADRICVLRDGGNAGALLPAEADHDKVVSMMVGREIKNRFPARRGQAGEAVLRVEELLVKGATRPVSFEARRGEVLGFAGLVGSGRSELMQAIFGAEPARSGSILIEGKRIAVRRPRQAIDAGIYLAPEDRKLQGLVLSMAVEHNLTLPALGARPGPLLRPRWERAVAEEQANRLALKTATLRRKTLHLSGGNQQKVVLGKWLAMKPRVLILDEPTRGIDVGAKAEVYRCMAELADAGLAIIMVSSDLEEVLGMSDRVAVMHARALAGILSREEAGEEAILRLAMGRTPRAA